jgi:hypothetical protein
MSNPPRQTSGEPSTSKALGTRSQSTKATDKTKEQLLAKPDSNIYDVTQARNFLERYSYVANGDQLTWSKLATIVLQLSQGNDKLQKHTTEGMRAVALVMDDMQAEEVTERVTGKVMKKLSPLMDTLTELTKEAGKAAEGLRAAAESNTRTMDEFREETHTIRDIITGAAEELEEKVSKIKEVNANQGDPGHDQQQPAMTYAAITRVQVAPQHDEVIARTHSREKQVLIDDTGSTTENMTERELVAKANMTIELMVTQAADKPEGEKLFLSAKRLARGGVLYLMVSTEAARWMRQSDVKRAFEEKYGGQAQIKDRGYNIILEYVPITFQPMSGTAQRVVERENGIEEGEIVSARYLKEEWRRAPGQRTAFVSITLKTAQTANKILREGLIVEGRQVRGRKNIQEARRCMKCQGYRAGHIAANCKQDHDTCASCGQNHRTKDCDAPQESMHCINCGTDGHRASDRNCPTFQKECQKVASRFPENNYIYFPVMNDPKTWGQTEQGTEMEERHVNKEGGGQQEEDGESIRRRTEETIRRETARLLAERGGEGLNWDEDVRRERREDDPEGGTSYRGSWRGGMRGATRGLTRGGAGGRGPNHRNASTEGVERTPTEPRAMTQRQTTLNGYVSQGQATSNNGQ